MVKKVLCLLFAAALCAAAVAYAQDAPSGSGSSQGNASQRQWAGEQAENAQNAQGDASTTATVRSKFVDNHIVASLLLCNQSEVALNQLAIDKAKSDQVKQFAQSLMKQQEGTVSQLRSMVSPAIIARLRLPDIAQVALNASRGTGDAGQVQPYRVMRPLGETGDASDTQSLTPLLDIDVRTAQNMVAITVSELVKQDGADFDKAFIGQQIAAHTYALARLRAIEPFVAGDLKQVIVDQQKITLQHLSQAKQIMETLQKS